MRWAANLAENEVAFRARRAPLRPDAVVLESFAGNDSLCNPNAILQSLLTSDDLRHLKFTWSLSGPAWHDRAANRYARHPRVTFVRRRSPQYYREVGSARYLINNATFPQAFAKRSGQIYLNTWHGTPLKSMGYHEPGGGAGAANIVRNFLAADYLLAPNDVTETMYLDSFRMRGIGRAQVLRVGTPRIDVQFGGTEAQDATRAQLRRHGVDLGDGHQRIVLFAPTWRGRRFDRPDDDLDRLCAEASAISAGLGNGVRLLVKVHQSIYAEAQQDGRLRGLLVPQSTPTNDVLAITDALVSDYSSIMVDYLTTGRPIVAFAPDLAEYARERGFSVPLEQFPAALCTTREAVVATLLTAFREPDATRSQRHFDAIAHYCPFEDGHAADRLIDIVFRGRAGAPGELAPLEAGRRRSMLINIGGLQSNGITSAALALLGGVDHSQVDVSVSYPDPRDEQARQLADRIDPRVRQLPRLGGTTWTRVRNTPLPVVGGRLPHDPHGDVVDARLTDESTRCFGGRQFDSVVDFGGYSAFFARLLAATAAGTRATWLHNDIDTEMHSRDRSPWLRANLRRTTTLYALSDRLVSVSAELARLNARLIEERGDGAQSVVARNMVDGERIRTLADQPLPVAANGEPIWCHDPQVRTFITVGRLTPQKNHLRLLEAFSRVRLTCPDVRLVIVGDGPLSARLRSAAAELGVADAVFFTGSLTNPFPLLAHADCFVLTSDYEGQPVALLEALVVGLPVVATDFPSVSDAVPGGAALIVGRDPDAVAEGMRTFLRGDLVGVALDDVVYNAAALAEFYRAAGVT